MFVLGIDPGLSRCGYCVLRVQARQKAEAVALGVLATPPSEPTARRLGMILTDIEALLEEFRPQAVALERVLFQVNVRTAMSVGQASGIVMASAARHGCEVVEYSPNQVKQVVGGYGSADKAQMQEMVRRILGFEAAPQPADAADAAAVALCHVAYQGPLATLAAGSAAQ